MIYRQSAIDIIRDIVEGLTFPVTIITATNNGGGLHTLEVCDMYHAQPGFQVTIGGKTYTITEVVPATQPNCAASTSDTLTVSGASTNITATTFNLYTPFFFHGTPIAQGAELSQVTQAKNKTPMVWVNDGTLEWTDSNDPTLNKERDIKCDLYCLTQGDPEKWVTDDAWEKAINPMERLRERIMVQLNAMPWRFEVEQRDELVKPFAKFGVFLSNRGMEKSLWHDKLSGVGNAMTLGVNRLENECVDCG